MTTTDYSDRSPGEKIDIEKKNGFMIKDIMYILIRMREKMGKTMLSRRGSRRCDGCCRWDSPTFFSMLIYYHYFLCWAGVSIYLATSERKNFSAVHPFLHFFLFAMNNLLDLKRVMNDSKYWRRSTLGGIRSVEF